MAAKLKSYPAMKDSGVPWLGDLPKNWDIRRMKTLLRERVEKGFPDEPLLAATQNRGVVRKEQYENRTVEAQKDLHLLKHVHEGDFVISLRSFQGGIEYARDQGIISPAYTVLYPDDPTIHGYLAWLFKSKPYVENLSLYVTGIRQGQNIDYDKLSRSFLPLPCSDERDSIVHFLDHMDRRIRRYIRAKQKLITLLEEQKQVIIHHAVTRGLDPSVPLKPSGMEWLGDVPEHWAFKRGKFYFREVDNRSATGKEELLSVSHITGVTPRSQKNINMFKAESYIGYKLCVPGQIAVNTMWAWMAAIGVSRYHGIISSSYHTYDQINKQNFHNDFLDLLLRSKPYKISYTLNSTGITSSRLRLYPEDFLNIKFLCPPRDEQESIVDWIKDATTDLNTASERFHREIALVKEYRARLISDVVTGKLDVRGIDLPAAEDVDAPEEHSALLDSESVIEDEEPQEIPTEVD